MVELQHSDTNDVDLTSHTRLEEFGWKVGNTPRIGTTTRLPPDHHHAHLLIQLRTTGSQLEPAEPHTEAPRPESSPLPTFLTGSTSAGCGLQDPDQALTEAHDQSRSARGDALRTSPMPALKIRPPPRARAPSHSKPPGTTDVSTDVWEEPCGRSPTATVPGSYGGFADRPLWWRRREGEGWRGPSGRWQAAALCHLPQRATCDGDTGPWRGRRRWSSRPLKLR